MIFSFKRKEFESAFKKVDDIEQYFTNLIKKNMVLKKQKAVLWEQYLKLEEDNRLLRKIIEDLQRRS